MVTKPHYFSMTNIHFFYGDDSFRLLKELDQLLSTIEVDDFNRVSIDNPDKIDPAAIATQILTPPFLGHLRLVTIKNMASNLSDKQAEALSGLLDSVPSTTILIITETDKVPKNSFIDKLKKRAENHSCAKLKGAEWQKFIDSELSRRSLKLEPSAREVFLTEYTGNTWGVNNIFDQLANYKGGALIHYEDIGLFGRIGFKGDVFKLIDFILAGNTVSALKHIKSLWRRFENPLWVLSETVSMYRALMLIKIAQTSNQSTQIINDIGVYTNPKRSVFPFILNKYIAYCRKTSRDEIEAMYEYIGQIDVMVKNGTMKPEEALEIMTYNLSRRNAGQVHDMVGVMVG